MLFVFYIIVSEEKQIKDNQAAGEKHTSSKINNADRGGSNDQPDSLDSLKGKFCLI